MISIEKIQTTGPSSTPRPPTAARGAVEPKAAEVSHPVDPNAPILLPPDSSIAQMILATPADENAAREQWLCLKVELLAEDVNSPAQNDERVADLKLRINKVEQQWKGSKLTSDYKTVLNRLDQRIKPLVAALENRVKEQDSRMSGLEEAAEPAIKHPTKSSAKDRATRDAERRKKLIAVATIRDAAQDQLDTVSQRLEIENRKITFDALGANSPYVLVGGMYLTKEEVAQREEKAAVVADLRARFGSPTAAADVAVARLVESKTILEASAAQSEDRIDPRKAMLYKALILGMSTAAKDRDAVSDAKPDMTFRLVNYNFKFVTQEGLLRLNQGFVLVAGAGGVWWPLQANVDGIDACWERYEHPLATKSAWEKAVSGYRNRVEHANEKQ